MKIGDAVDAEHHGLAVDHELLQPVLKRGLDDPRVAAGPVVAIARDQPHVAAVALQPDGTNASGIATLCVGSSRA